MSSNATENVQTKTGSLGGNWEEGALANEWESWSTEVRALGNGGCVLGHTNASSRCRHVFIEG